jgi:hypothetical protein
LKENACIGAWFVALTVGLVSLIAVVVVLSLLGAGGTLFGLAVDNDIRENESFIGDPR